MNSPGIILPHIELSQSFLLGVLALVFTIFVIFSIVLYYHWRAYTERARILVLAELIYFTGGAILFSAGLILIGIF